MGFTRTFVRIFFRKFRLEYCPAGPTLPLHYRTCPMLQPTARFFFSYYFYYANA
jgi:hypothetical protein